MRDERLSCPACGRRMERGFLLEKGDHNAMSATRWVEGAPERSFWTGLKLKGRRALPVTTYRCTSCGALASFAPDSPGSA
jgi:DNA-directed RNA polymerase subunit RPC12/RpoP